MSFLLRNNLKRLSHILRPSFRCYSEMPDRNKPVKFTTSDAASWKAEYSRQGNIYDDSPDAQPFIVSLSTFVFMFYFFFYREESDIDQRVDLFGGSLYDKVEGLEEVQLKIVREDKLNKGEDVREIDERLLELEKLRLEKALNKRTA